tara:strand:+ start:58 stop:312 length:255 start_codon:yes stop_codon:yes gene_type:complete
MYLYRMGNKMKVHSVRLFAFDINNIQNVESYLRKRYDKGLDYIMYTNRGDDAMNGLEMSKTLSGDKKLQRLIDICDQVEQDDED